MVVELLAEFVEERVRQSPTKTFCMDDVTRAISSLADETGMIELKRDDAKWIPDWLDRHPFLRRGKAGAVGTWKPGFNKGAFRRVLDLNSTR